MQVRLHLWHLVYLGTITGTHISELGPAPVEVPDEIAGTVVEHLTAIGILDESDPTALTAHGTALLAPLTQYAEAFAGLLLLHNQRQPVRLDIDDNWREYLAETFSDTPRVHILVTRAGADTTVAVRSGDDIDIHTATRADKFASTAARALRSVTDPDGTWQPVKLPLVRVPQKVIIQALTADPAMLARGPAADSDDPDEAREHSENVGKFTTMLADGGMSADTQRTVGKLMRFDHVAAAHITHISGVAGDMTGSAVTVDFFHDEGVTVSEQFVAPDGQTWKQIRPATPDAVSEALAALRKSPHSAASATRHD